jgi:hypothetical protein
MRYTVHRIGYWWICSVIHAPAALLKLYWPFLSANTDSHACQLGCDDIVSKPLVALSVGAISALSQGQKSESASGEARGGGGLGAEPSYFLEANFATADSNAAILRAISP